ncbi:MAG TPA: vitamin K epoxide reductase family protein [Actinopolymorphaceae bacterium]|nr:vitamin K epoxide reductase family protein [Actinopolymorphaceae bacterium]
MPPTSDVRSHTAPRPLTRTPPRWAMPVSFALCLAGLAVSAYLTYAHFTSATVLSCPDTALVNCVKITTSPQSMLFGVVPVAVAGLGYFVAMTLLCSPPAWGGRRAGTDEAAGRPARWAPFVRWSRVAGVVAGVGMVCYLVYVELVVLDALCVYCTAVHVLTLLLFGTVLFAEALGMPTAEAGP